MKLHAENIIALDRGRELAAIFSRCRGLLDDRRSVGMRVVKERMILNAAQQTRIAAKLNLVPADVRRLYRRREARALAGEQGCPGRFRRLRAALKQPLHAHADAEKWFALANRFEHRPSQLL